jgi:hypothetical protein
MKKLLMFFLGFLGVDMRYVFLLGLSVALSGCVTTAQVNRFCADAAPARAAALATIASIDATCPNGALTPDLEAYCVTAEKIRNAAALTLNQIDAACSTVFYSSKRVEQNMKTPPDAKTGL